MLECIKHIHINISKDLSPKEDEMGNTVCSAMQQMLVKHVESIDDAICKEIRDMAIANGIDDVYLLDKKKILTALQKQILRRPDFEGDGYDDNGELIYDIWICPCCAEHYEVDYDDYKFCPNCGQALDWSDSQ